jgi:glycosyl hydrolase family 113
MLVLLATPLSPAGARPPADDAIEGGSTCWQRGITLTGWQRDTYAGSAAVAALDRLSRLGMSHVAVIVTWYMDAASSTSIAADPMKTPSDSSLLRVISLARARGLNVVLKPHVNVRDGTFRGDIRPSDPAAWFTSYRRMINHYAELAEQANVATFVVGTELTSMSSRKAEFGLVIDAVRARFTGALTFAANLIDGAQRVTFWDRLDYIGIDAYMPLSTGDLAPSVEELRAAWYRTRDAAGRLHAYVAEISALHVRYRKPVLFTEIGYQSREGTTASPWGGARGPLSETAQQHAYEAAFQIWSQLPWFCGTYWWSWRADGDTEQASGGWSPEGKRAEQTLATWNQRLGSTATQRR